MEGIVSNQYYSDEGNGALLYIVPTAAEAVELRHQGFSPVWTEKSLVSRVWEPLA